MGFRITRHTQSQNLVANKSEADHDLEDEDGYSVYLDGDSFFDRIDGVHSQSIDPFVDEYSHELSTLSCSSQQVVKGPQLVSKFKFSSEMQELVRLTKEYEER